jgi:branched-chain amino acid transport system substrate-binding protein
VATVERNSVEVSPAVQAIAKVNPQAVVMVTLYKATAAFVREMRQARQTPQFMTLSPVGADLLVQELGDEARGIGISQVMPYPWNDTIPLVREYQRLLGKQGKPSYFGVEAYAMAKSSRRCVAQEWQGSDPRQADQHARKHAEPRPRGLSRELLGQ